MSVVNKKSQHVAGEGCPCSGRAGLETAAVAAGATARMLAIPQPGDGGAELLLELVDGGVEIRVLHADVHPAAADVDRNCGGVPLVLVADVLGGEGEAQDGALREVLQALPESFGELLVGVVFDARSEREADSLHDDVQDCLSS